MTMPSSDERNASVRHAQRASGQVSAVGAMIGVGRPFAEVVQQLLAARGSLDSLLVRMIGFELRVYVPSREGRDEVDGLLRTALGRNAPNRSGHRARRELSAQRSNAHLEEGRTP